MYELVIKDAGYVLWAASVKLPETLQQKVGDFERNILGKLSDLTEDYEVLYEQGEFSIEKKNMSLYSLGEFIKDVYERLEGEDEYFDDPKCEPITNLPDDFDSYHFNQDYDD